MTRPIITDTLAQEPKPAEQTASQVRPAAPPNVDTLAGAFPAWDLVPMIHFVRRVK